MSEPLKLNNDCVVKFANEYFRTRLATDEDTHRDQDPQLECRLLP